MNKSSFERYILLSFGFSEEKLNSINHDEMEVLYDAVYLHVWSRLLCSLTPSKSAHLKDAFYNKDINEIVRMVPNFIGFVRKYGGEYFK